MGESITGCQCSEAETARHWGSTMSPAVTEWALHQHPPSHLGPFYMGKQRHGRAEEAAPAGTPDLPLAQLQPSLCSTAPPTGLLQCQPRPQAASSQLWKAQKVLEGSYKAAPGSGECAASAVPAWPLPCPPDRGHITTLAISHSMGLGVRVGVGAQPRVCSALRHASRGQAQKASWISQSGLPLLPELQAQLGNE